MLSNKQVLTGILLWVLIFGAFVTLAGITDFLTHLGAITPREFGGLLLAVAVGVVAMGSCLHVISRYLGLASSLIETIFLNTTVSLAHNLTPFGQAGGAPIGAVILARRYDGDYEECLAALSIKDIVSFTPAILVFVFGGGYIVLFVDEVPGELQPLFAGFALFVIAVVAVVLTIRRYPTRMRRVLRLIGRRINLIASRIPFVPSLDPDELAARIDNFADSMGEIASDRPTVALASALATTAFVAQGCLLWLTLDAVGIDVPVALAIFIVPVSLLASGLPLPGGSGGVESVQILMLLATTEATSSATITAVVLSRGMVFWTPIVLGSLTLLAFQLDRLATS